jgi:hypothetical protein
MTEADRGSRHLAEGRQRSIPAAIGAAIHDEDWPVELARHLNDLPNGQGVEARGDHLGKFEVSGRGRRLNAEARREERGGHRVNVVHAPLEGDVQRGRRRRVFAQNRHARGRHAGDDAGGVVGLIGGSRRLDEQADGQIAKGESFAPSERWHTRCWRSSAPGTHGCETSPALGSTLVISPVNENPSGGRPP